MRVVTNPIARMSITNILNLGLIRIAYVIYRKILLILGLLQILKSHSHFRIWRAADSFPRLITYGILPNDLFALRRMRKYYSYHCPKTQLSCLLFHQLLRIDQLSPPSRASLNKDWWLYFEILSDRLCCS